MMNFYEKKEDQIRWAQAMNLAVELLPALGDRSRQIPAEEAKPLIRGLRTWFYEELSKPSPRANQYPSEQHADEDRSGTLPLEAKVQYLSDLNFLGYPSGVGLMIASENKEAWASRLAKISKPKEPKQ